MARMPFRWGPLLGTWHGGPSVMQMGFEGQGWSLKRDLTLGVQTWGGPLRLGWGLKGSNGAQGGISLMGTRQEDPLGMRWEVEVSPRGQSKCTLCA